MSNLEKLENEFKNSEKIEKPFWELWQQNPRSKIRKKIIVAGIGGGGGHAVHRMLDYGIQGIDYIIVDTDKQDLFSYRPNIRIQIGEKLTKGLGTGANPDIGQKAAEESHEILADRIRGADMVFVIAGLGGGTGTGAAPVIAEYAKQEGILTLGVVMPPFFFEGKRRKSQAEDSIVKLKECTDALVVMPNDFLLALIDQRSTLEDIFSMSDEMLCQSVQGITDMIVKPGLINADFADLRAMLSGAGIIHVGFGAAKGYNGAAAAARYAVRNVMFRAQREASVTKRFNVLVSLTGGVGLTLFEAIEAVKTVEDETYPSADILFNVFTDRALQDEVQITIIVANSP